MGQPDRVITRAHVVVIREDLSEREMEIDLAVKLKEYQIDSIRVERVGETTRDATTSEYENTGPSQLGTE